MTDTCVAPVATGVCGVTPAEYATSVDGPLCPLHWGKEEEWLAYQERFEDGAVPRPMHNRYDLAAVVLNAGRERTFTPTYAMGSNLEQALREEMSARGVEFGWLIRGEDRRHLKRNLKYSLFDVNDLLFEATVDMRAFVERMLYRYFGIDYDRFYQEKDAILKFLQQRA